MFIEHLDNNLQNGNAWLTAQAFWVRRFYRLLPSAWLWILIPTILSFSFNSSTIFSTFSSNFKSIISVLTFSGNFAQRNGGGLGINFIYWSLSLEEQFYFIFPIFLIIFTKNMRWKILLGLIFVQFCIDRSGGWTSIFWAGRLDAMMWGVIIYLFSVTSTYRHFSPTVFKNPLKAAGITILLIFLTLTIPIHLQNLPTMVGMLAVVCAGLVTLASYNQGYIHPLIGDRIALWAGSRSYAIYLCHMPIFYLTHEIWFRYTHAAGLASPNGTYTLRYLFTAIPLVILAAELNYRFIENPMRKRGSIVAKRILLLASSRSEKSPVDSSQS
jgi:peptidoglycan/LPS O-acetylase OafA/YrhL